jgi:hypothetical protein
MESLGYMLIELLKGSLPWVNVDRGSGFEEAILEMKQNPAECNLFAGVPSVFVDYFDHLKALPEDGEPDYKKYRKRFSTLLRKQNQGSPGRVFDWTELKFLESLGPDDQKYLEDE